jgi:acetylornithine deacetylase/succinyl-diaminopimelate desuccinylase-like protein
VSAAAIAHARTHRERAVTELCELLRFPSVSSQPRQAADVRACAQWLASHLRRIGRPRVEIVSTPRHPLVVGEWCGAPGRPHLLVYGHYDVQPVEPLAEWRTPPFEPTRRGDNLHARGASDDKGQLFAHVKALEAYAATAGHPPVNVTVLLDGEEEIGSPNLKPFLARRGRALGADAAVVSDTRILGPERPAITYGLRGGLAFELEARGQASDLHSGSFGGAVHNPLQALCEVVAALHDRRRRVAIPGFYDRVRRPTAAERAYAARVGPADAAILADARAEGGWGEPGYTLHERTTIRPALTVNGLTGGHQGPGGKAVIPSRASAKLSFRLVPDQDPDEVERLTRAHFARVAPPTVRLGLTRGASSRPVLLERGHPVTRAAALAYRRAFGRTPVFLRSGGSIPIVNLLHESLRVPTVLMGFALPDDRIHAPNEKLHLPTFQRAIETCIHFYHALGRGQ